MPAPPRPQMEFPAATDFLFRWWAGVEACPAWVRSSTDTGIGRRNTCVAPPAVFTGAVIRAEDAIPPRPRHQQDGRPGRMPRSNSGNSGRTSMHFLKIALVAGFTTAMLAGPVLAQGKPAEIKIGITTFLSGPASV